MSHGFELEGHGPAQAVAPPGGLAGAAHKALASVNNIVLNISMLALILAAGVLSLSVALRYFLKVPTDWQDEMAVFLLVGVTFMCGAQVQSLRGHIGIEAVAGLLSPTVNRIRQLLCDILSGLFCAFFSWKSWTLLHEAWVDGQTTSSSWAPPLWIPYGLMSVGMTLLTLQIAAQAFAALSSACAAAPATSLKDAEQ
jgi:TRAP-type C4-dicarboxylate transport system permease small subunit